MKAITSAVSSCAKRPAVARRACASREPRHACAARTAGENITSSGGRSVPAAGGRRRDIVTPQGQRSLLPGVVSGIEISDVPRSRYVELKDRFLSGPGEVVHLGRHEEHRPGAHGGCLLRVELVAHADIDSPGQHSDPLDPWVVVRRNLVVGRKLYPGRDGTFLVHLAFDDGDFCTRWQSGYILPFEIVRRDDHVRAMLGPNRARQAGADNKAGYCAKRVSHCLSPF